MSPSNNFFLKAWDSNRDSFPIFQASIPAWFESPSFGGVTNFTETLPGTKHQSPLIRLRIMSGILLYKILSIFFHNPAYKRDRFIMWGQILE